jgi:choloylglycine hydrolase
MCTGIRLTTTTGAVVHARTMEFAEEVHSDVIVVPRRYELMATAPGGRPGATWTATHAAVGTNTHGLPLLIDGVNERGLVAGAFYHPGYAEYQAFGAGAAARTLSPVDVPVWILTRFASVEAVEAGLREVSVSAGVFGPWGFVPPLHYVVHDATGRSMVIEYIDHQLKLHDNPLGVLTNAPDFDWHITNLRNYINLTATNVPKMALSGVRLFPTGEGTGMLGLPGDFTPPSRFVRAVAFSQAALHVDTPEEAVQLAFHLLANCEIPRGAVRSRYGDRLYCDYTQYTTAIDTANRRFYFHTYGNRRVRMLDLMKMNLDAGRLTTFPMQGPEDVQELMAPAWPSDRCPDGPRHSA